MISPPINPLPWILPKTILPPLGLEKGWLYLCEYLQGVAFTAPKIPLWVGYSGGLDSTVLLHALHSLQMAGAPIELRALHVHHGLNPGADAWASHCLKQCETWHIEARVVRVDVARDSGLGIEAAGRDERYRAYADLGSVLIALAHHADDQAETVLLQLLRGAGTKGLSAMPRIRPLAVASQTLPKTAEGGYLWRPLLSYTKEDLKVYAKEHALKWVEDTSNEDISLRRNFLRARIIPLLSEQFPSAVQNIARSASHQSEAVYLQEQLAIIDLAVARVSKEGSPCLDLSVLLGWDDRRLKNALRYWVIAEGYRAPSTARLDSLIDALRTSTNDTRLCWEHENMRVRRIKGYIINQAIV